MEKRDLIILSNLDKDKVLLSYIKGEQNHPMDKMVHLVMNIKCIIITLSRKVNNINEINTNLKFYKDICNKQLKEHFKHSHLAEIVNEIPKEELKHILLEDFKIDSDNDEDFPQITNVPKNNSLNRNQTHGLKKKNARILGIRNSVQDLENYSSSIKNECDFQPNDRILIAYQSPKHKIGRNENLKEEISDQKSSNNKSVEYLDKFSFEEKVITTKEEEFQSKGFLNQSKFNHNLKSENKSKKQESNSCFLSKNKTHKVISYTKSIFSIVIGHLHYNHSILRNQKFKMQAEVNSFTIFDHNLSTLILNKGSPIDLKVKENNFYEDNYSEKNSDFISIIFNSMFYEKNIHHFVKEMELVPTTIAIFLNDTFQSYIIKDKKMFCHFFSLSEEFETGEHKFIKDYFHKFGLKKLDY